MEHLFRHGAGICGMWASSCGGVGGGGFEQGETLCHITCLDMSCSLVCLPV